jgi:hypothetical protein
VPSCSQHNNDNAKDVEYVRLVVVSALQTNEHARELGSGKVIRLLKNSPTLFEGLFKDSIPVTANGEKTLAFTVDMPRLRKVMEAIAYGLHSLHFGRRFFGTWWFYSPEMVSFQGIKENKDYKLDRLRDAFRKIPVETVSTPYPEIFNFGVFTEGTNEHIFRLQFYGGFSVYARSIPFYKVSSIPKGAF